MHHTPNTQAQAVQRRRNAKARMHTPRTNALALAAQLAVAGTMLALGSTATQNTWAQTADVQAAAQSYNIPAGTLDSVLARFLSQSGVLLSGNTQLTEGKSSAGLNGSYSVEAGLGVLLQGSGLEAVRQADGSYALQPVKLATQTGRDAQGVLPEVVVTAAPSGPSDLQPAYAGGQVAAGARVGLLGNKDFMETPFSITSYTEEFIRNRQSMDITEVIAATDPSVDLKSPSK